MCALVTVPVHYQIHVLAETALHTMVHNAKISIALVKSRLIKQCVVVMVFVSMLTLANVQQATLVLSVMFQHAVVYQQQAHNPFAAVMVPVQLLTHAHALRLLQLASGLAPLAPYVHLIMLDLHALVQCATAQPLATVEVLVTCRL